MTVATVFHDTRELPLPLPRLDSPVEVFCLAVHGAARRDLGVYSELVIAQDAAQRAEFQRAKAEGDPTPQILTWTEHPAIPGQYSAIYDEGVFVHYYEIQRFVLDAFPEAPAEPVRSS